MLGGGCTGWDGRLGCPARLGFTAELPPDGWAGAGWLLAGWPVPDAPGPGRVSDGLSAGLPVPLPPLPLPGGVVEVEPPAGPPVLVGGLLPAGDRLPTEPDGPGTPARDGAGVGAGGALNS